MGALCWRLPVVDVAQWNAGCFSNTLSDIVCDGRVKMDMVDVNITSNVAGSVGGGIALMDDTIATTCTRCHFASNHAASAGGAVFTTATLSPLCTTWAMLSGFNNSAGYVLRRWRVGGGLLLTRLSGVCVCACACAPVSGLLAVEPTWEPLPRPYPARPTGNQPYSQRPSSTAQCFTVRQWPLHLRR